MGEGRLKETGQADSLLLYAPKDLRWLRADLTPPGSGEVWLSTLAGAVSVGTELALYRSDARGAEAHPYPLMTGYESLGRVVAVGEGVTAVEVGTRVVATYGHRTGACVPAKNLMLVPDDVPDEIALLAVLSNDASRGVGKLRLNRGDPVLITGAGTIGLLALHRLRWLGFTKVDVVEPLAPRRTLALSLGARSVFLPEALPEPTYTAGVECSSAQAAFALLQRHLRPEGQVCVLADGNIEPLTLTPEFHRRELSVVASSDGEDYPGHARAFFDRWRETKAPLDKLFTRRIAAADLPEVFGEMLESPPVKVFVSYP
ncbi:MAG: hypothetical protein AVDCRST_MAG86-1049 [uncultured Truepera sp.]|uniref:Alcohol dehydrogenase-like N-terminal domain-containing protein n=1 Tax=uncultured Truepera sp. TaxID=543023 RepID=A0A6J4V1J0_9DEIN|nr:MAG: hypothetical protein AVDCRST_MAG86-1049 [uncultured Truepera sp.]